MLNPHAHRFTIFWLTSVTLSVLLGLACGYVYNSVSVTRFISELTREAESLQVLTSSYISAYSEARLNADSTHAIVPAEFRAKAQRRFNQFYADDEQVKALMVGLQGSHISTAPTDDELARQLEKIAATDSGVYERFSAMHRTAGERMLRSVFPSVVTQQSCADCHNKLQDNLHDWQLGDLMGAYVIDRSVEDALDNFFQQAMLVTILSTAFFLSASIVFRQYRKLQLQSEQLNLLAHTDSLTGCCNRRSLLASIQRVYEQQGIAGGLIMFDLDHFKKVNDTFGHEFGDKVLIHVAEQVRDIIRVDDILARIGGEEFVVYLPACDEKTSLEIARKICTAVAQTPFHYQGTSTSLSVSIGLVQMINTPKNIFSEWLGAADRLLYEAKELGRNQVSHRLAI